MLPKRNYFRPSAILKALTNYQEKDRLELHKNIILVRGKSSEVPLILH